MGNLVTALDQQDKTIFTACTMSMTRLHKATLSATYAAAYSTLTQGFLAFWRVFELRPE
jgi:hypothetical protein